MAENHINSAPDRQVAKPVEFLVAEHPFLAGLRPEHLRLLAQNAMRVSYRPGEVIFREGDPANRFYLIERGSVLLEAHPRAGPVEQIQTIGAGDVLGWSWLFPPYIWHFEAVALEPTTAIFFYGTRLREHCDEDPELGYELMKRVAGVLIDRLQQTRRQFLALSQKLKLRNPAMNFERSSERNRQ